MRICRLIRSASRPAVQPPSPSPPPPTSAADQCPDSAAPEWVGDAGTLLLVAYLVVMAVILFNLLIAILSTAHYEVRIRQRSPED